MFACGLRPQGTPWALGRAGGDDHPFAEVVVPTASNLSVTVMRPMLMRAWIFRRP